MTVLRIANLTGVSPSSIVSDDVYSFDDLATLVAAKPELRSLGDLSEDEKAMVRLIRVLDDETVRQAVAVILDGLHVDRCHHEAIDVVNFEDDFTRLALIREGELNYIRGYTIDSLKTILEALAFKKAHREDGEK